LTRVGGIHGDRRIDKKLRARSIFNLGPALLHPITLLFRTGIYQVISIDV